MQSLLHINRYKVIFPGHDNGQNEGQKVTDKKSRTKSHMYNMLFINIDSCFKVKWFFLLKERQYTNFEKHLSVMGFQ